MRDGNQNIRVTANLRVPIALLFVLTVLTVTSLSAQNSTTGDIAGTITDQTSAVVSGVSVTLKNLENGASTSTITNGEGAYNFPFLQPGNYSITATGSGFQTSPCYNTANCADPTSDFATQRRNQFRGPGYFDTDFDFEKAFDIPKWESAKFSVGARFFNFFNHPNFAFPNTNIDSNQFGQITSTVSQPTTIYGSGLGADASPRVIEIQAKFVF